MATDTPRRRAGRSATFTEQARRTQLIEVTIELVAQHGYAGCSLQRIAGAAGITKAAVIYHFASKAAVFRAAYDAVITELVEHLTARIEAAATAEEAVEAYLSAMIDHLGRRPGRARLIIEAIGDETTADTGIEDSPTSASRRQGLADLIEAARADGTYRADVDPAALAIVLGGAVDAVVATAQDEPDLDLAAATTELLGLLRHGARQLNH